MEMCWTFGGSYVSSCGYVVVEDVLMNNALKEKIQMSYKNQLGTKLAAGVNTELLIFVR